MQKKRNTSVSSFDPKDLVGSLWIEEFPKQPNKEPDNYIVLEFLGNTCAEYQFKIYYINKNEIFNKIGIESLEFERFAKGEKIIYRYFTRQIVKHS